MTFHALDTRLFNRRDLGYLPVPIKTLQRKLGQPAFLTWQALVGCRDGEGKTHVTRRGLRYCRGDKPYAERVIQKALARLKAAGLIYNKGWQNMLVPCGRERSAKRYLPVGYSDSGICGQGSSLVPRAVREVYLRVVFGVPAEADSGRVVLVLPPTLKWLEVAATHGGKRTGSGRKRKAEFPYNSNQEIPHLSQSRGSADLDPLFSLSDHTFGFSLSEKNAPLCAAPFSLSKNSPTLPVSTQLITTHTGDAAPTLEAPPEISSAPIVSTSAPTPPPQGFEVRQTSLGSVLSGGGLPYLPPRERDGWTPPRFPGFDVVDPATVPDPQPLDPKLSAEERVIMLARVYRGACDAAYKGSRSMVLVGGVRKSKHFKALAEAAQTMIANDVAPAAWIAWSIDVWKNYGKTDKAPPIAWVLASARIETRLGWFHNECDAYGGGLLIISPAHKDLLYRHARMTTAINRRVPPREAAAQHFPDGLYDKLVVKAREESRDLHARVRAQAARGQWVW